MNVTSPAQFSGLPIVCTDRLVPKESSGALETLLITGAAGTIGTVAAETLRDRFRLVSLDIEKPKDTSAFDNVIIGNVSDRSVVLDAVAETDYILHLAGGVSRGWDGLMEVEMTGTRNVVDAAITTGCARLILASSNHISGWSELDLLSGISVTTADPRDPIRPDGIYAASKAFVEALGRGAAEYSGLPVSVLRIGTMRHIDDPGNLANDPSFSYIGTPEMIVARMQRTWLYHEDFRQIVLEELEATETFRLRYAVSGIESPWSTDVFSWAHTTTSRI